MKSIILILTCLCFSVCLIAQTEKQDDSQSNTQIATTTPVKFKPTYAGTSMDVGFLFMPRIGSAYYVAPKINFHVTPRLFINTGITVVQYNFQPSQVRYETLERWAGTNQMAGASQRAGASPAPTSAYIFTEGVYLLNERWSVNGSAIKNITPLPFRNLTPYQLPNEAIHLGVDYKVTPNVTVGARVGYTSN